MSLVRYLIIIGICGLYACKTEQPSHFATYDNTADKSGQDILENSIIQLAADTFLTYDYDTAHWVELKSMDRIQLDLKYATADNFTKTKIYPCSRCFFRPQVASKIIELAAQAFDEKGFDLIIYDCYRPQPAQQRLWDIVPDPTYVANPSKGSMHNRGLAVDLGFIDMTTGGLVDMGTAFDHFGPAARHAFTELDTEVIANRKYLKSLMESYGFKSIKSEWWHYSLSGTGYQLSDWEWSCN